MHTPVIDYVNGEPYVRLEPAAANLLFSSRTFTAAAGWTLSNATTAKDAVGIDGVANSGTTVTDASANYGKFIRGISKSASDSTTYFLNSIYVKKVTSTSAYPILEVSFIDVSTKYAQCIINHITGVLTANPANAAANASFTIEDKGLWWKVSASATDNGANTTAAFSLYPAGSSDGTTLSATAQGSCVIDAAMLTTGSIPSSYFAGAAAIGSELVTDGTFDVVTTGEALSSGLLTIGNCYKIATRTDGDFVAAGAPDNNVGTYFNATTTGAGLLDAGDTANPITFTNWTAGAGWAPQATAGALTGKAQKIAGTSSTFWQNGVVSADSVFRFGTVATVSAGTCYFYSYGQSVGTTINVSGTFTDYKIIPTSIPNTRAGFIADAAFVGTIDNFSVKEHGTVRLSEANTTTLAIPAAVAAILAAGTGTIVIKGRFAFARAAGVVTAILSSQNATASLAYTTTAAGNLSSFDATTVAESTGAYAANVDWKIAITFPSSAGKYRIGVDADGAGIVQGAEVAFDGDFTTGVNLILGRVLHGATWIEWIEIFDEVITDAQIDGM